ncbi:DsbA family protein [Streptomyces sp. NBC_00487]|uniref:DsbA family protein n=1 Tax=Streptomyces sp. NBC_00487 TaxID=2903656 RepID=UPI002E16E86A
MPTAERASLTYVFDAYCAWYYGFGPTLRAFAEHNAHRIRLTVVSAGPYTGARALPVAAYPHLSAERGTVTRLTGVASARATTAPWRGERPCSTPPPRRRGRPRCATSPASANWTRPRPCSGRGPSKAAACPTPRSTGTQPASSGLDFPTSALDQRLTTTIPHVPIPHVPIPQVPIHDLPLRGEPS